MKRTHGNGINANMWILSRMKVIQLFSLSHLFSTGGGCKIRYNTIRYLNAYHCNVNCRVNAQLTEQGAFNALRGRAYNTVMPRIPVTFFWYSSTGIDIKIPVFRY